MQKARVVALALAGGGAKGSFEVGAVRYLYDHGVRPNMLCATSVGALLAVKLAEGEGGPTQGLAGLERLWLGLNQNSDMYVEHPWLTNFRTKYPTLYGIVPPMFKPTDPEPAAYQVVAGSVELPVFGKSIGSSIAAVMVAPERAVGWLIENGVDCASICDQLGRLLEELKSNPVPKGLFSLAPIQGLMASGLDLALIQKWAAAGGKLRLATVALESGKLRYISESGQVFERDNSTPVYKIPDVKFFDPSCQQIGSNIVDIDKQIRDLGPKPPVDSKAFETWSQKYDALTARLNEEKSKLDTCLREHPPTMVPDVATGAFASAALPAYFQPVKLGSETYTDGGVRDDMPVDIAAQMGANVIYAINDSPNLGADSAYDDSKSVIDVIERTISLLADEVAYEAETSVPSTSTVDVKLIKCTYAEDQDTVQIHPAFIRINMSYGYMRAADTVNPAALLPLRCYELADRITNARRLLFNLECRVNGAGPQDQQVSVPMLRWGKGMLSLLLLERYQLGGATPQDATQCWMNWEKHRFAMPAPTPFHSIGSVPANIQVADFIPKDNTLLREEKSNDIFVILGSAAFHVPSPQELTALGLQNAPIQTVLANSIRLMAVIPREATLIRERNASFSFFIQNGAKREVTPEAIKGGRLPPHPPEVTAPVGSLSSIPNGPPIT